MVAWCIIVNAVCLYYHLNPQPPDRFPALQVVKIQTHIHKRRVIKLEEALHRNKCYLSIHGYLDRGGKARWPAIHGWSMDGTVTLASTDT